MILNGIKFHGEETPIIHISAEKKANEWVFSVHDKELELIHNIQKKFLKYLKSSIQGTNILEQE